MGYTWQKLVYNYWTADSKPYPHQLLYNDIYVQGHANITKNLPQWACSPEAGGASKHHDHMQDYLCPCQESEKENSAEMVLKQITVVGQKVHSPHCGKCV